MFGFILPPWISVPLAIAGRILRAIPWQVWLALGVAVLLLLSHWQYGRQQYAKAEAIGKAETAAVQAKFDAYVKADREAAEAAKKLAREAEAAQREALAAIEAKHQREMDDAKRKADAVAAGLRAGNLRLRKQWQGCSAAGGRDVSGAAADPAGAGETDELRATGAGDLVRIGAEADAVTASLLRGWQACEASKGLH